MPKRTYQPKKRRRLRRHGFMKRMSTANGRQVLQRRRAKGRARLTVQGSLKSRDRRLRRQADFDRVFRTGRHNSTPLLAVRSIANDLGVTRLAVPASKRIGNAVVRNRVRRRLKEAFRCLSVIEGFDVVITPRSLAAKATFSQLKGDLELMLSRARLLMKAKP